MPRTHVYRAASAVAVLAAAVWLGGLVALGAVAAPIVFAVAPWPSNADAMTLVFRRFDDVAMSCAALVLLAEAGRAALRASFSRAEVARVALAVLAAAAAVAQGSHVSPRIAALHAGGAIRGVGAAGAELARLHDWAERLGKAEIALLGVLIVLQAWEGAGRSRVDGGSAQP
jgi:putative copper export protein